VKATVRFFGSRVVVDVSTTINRGTLPEIQKAFADVEAVCSRVREAVPSADPVEAVANGAFGSLRIVSAIHFPGSTARDADSLRAIVEESFASSEAVEPVCPGCGKRHAEPKTVNGVTVSYCPAM
jgi:hypothetical protein